MKTEQTAIVSALCDRWTSYDVIKHHMITSDVRKICFACLFSILNTIGLSRHEQVC